MGKKLGHNVRHTTYKSSNECQLYPQELDAIIMLCSDRVKSIFHADAFE